MSASFRGVVAPQQTTKHTTTTTASCSNLSISKSTQLFVCSQLKLMKNEKNEMNKKTNQRGFLQMNSLSLLLKRNAKRKNGDDLGIALLDAFPSCHWVSWENSRLLLSQKERGLSAAGLLGHPVGGSGQECAIDARRRWEARKERGERDIHSAGFLRGHVLFGWMLNFRALLFEESPLFSPFFLFPFPFFLFPFSFFLFPFFRCC